MIIAKDVRDDS